MPRENIKRPANNKAGKSKKSKNEEVILPPINRYPSPPKNQIIKPLTEAPPLIRKGLVPNNRQNNNDLNLKFP